MKHYKWIWIIIYCGWFSQAFAQTLIVLPDAGRQPIIQLINQANKQLDLVMYGLTDKTLLNALLKAKQRGVRVRIILEKEPYRAITENKKALTALLAADITPLTALANVQFIHEKLLLSDNQAALVMTFNFTQSAFRKERNFALLVDDQETLNALKQTFNTDWEKQAPTATQASIVISPINSRSVIEDSIAKAKEKIWIYAQSLSDYDILGALAAAADRGVQVRILTSNTPRPKQYKFLTKHGVQFSLNKKLYIHAKTIMIDDQKLILGSINLTRYSLDKNRELALITTDQAVIKNLNTVFNQDWQMYG